MLHKLPEDQRLDVALGPDSKRTEP